MSGHVTTVPAFVRTDAGTVQLEAGAPVPASVLESEVTRLVAAGVLVEESPADGEQSGDPDTTTEAPRGRRRGQSGSTGKP